MPWPFTTRMTVVQLASGELFLHSPIAFDVSLAAHLQSLGRVRHLVSPNRGHYAHIGEWARAFPEATAWASPGVRERARSQRIDVQFQRDLETRAPPDWRGEIDQTIIPGARLDSPNDAFDRFICTFVLDLLPDDEAQAVMKEAHRVMRPGGLAGLVSLTNGKTPIAWTITTIWNGLRAVSPILVGGCRPIEILGLVTAPDWSIEYQSVVTPFGVPCEIVVARKTSAP